MNNILEKLLTSHSLELLEYEYLIDNQNLFSKQAAALADAERKKIYGNSVFIRGLIEIGNVCRNDCLYCGISKSNKNCQRYILSKEQILMCCREGYKTGFRTFVLQGGEGAMPVDGVCDIVSSIKNEFPDCAVTLSLGEYEKKDYEKMFSYGADRYLLRHETADKEHYMKLHPENMSFEKRMKCLENLKETGFQVGVGFMVGSPYQTAKTLAKDLKFIETFSPDMCGIGPFISHKDTPFKSFKNGTAEQTVYLLSLIRLIKPNILLPSTTALSTVSDSGRMLGIKAGANVIMPNLSPMDERKKYMLYDNKKITNEESAKELEKIKESLRKIGYCVKVSRGDIIK